MEAKQHTQSVIAKLMGLEEELPPKQHLPSTKKRRVLSENYLQKTASIALREKSSIVVGRSIRINTQKQQQVVNLSEVQMQDIFSHERSSQSAAKTKIKRYTDSFVKESDGISGDLLSGSDDLARNLQWAYGFSGLNYADISKLGNRSTRTIDRDTLRSKLETGNFGEFGIDQTKKIDFHFKPQEKPRHTKIVLLRPNSRRFHNTKNHLFSHRSDMELESVNAECKEFTRTENRAVDNEEAERGSVVNSVEPLRNSFRVPTAVSQKTSHPIRNKVSHSSKPIPRAIKVNESFLKSAALKPPSSSLFNNTREDGPSHSFANKSFLAEEAKKQIVERLKLIDSSQEVEVGPRSHTLGEMFSMAELETRTQHKSSSNISPGNTVANVNDGNIRSSSEITDELQCEPNLSRSYVEDGNTAAISVEQDSWNGSHEKRSLSTKHAMVDPEYPQNLRETNQPSPNSVLEPPFKEEKLCTSELNDRYVDLYSVAMQLELLDTNSEETYSEGSEMAVSTDDDDDIERASLDRCQENIKVLINFNTEESRDYSYLLDVLDEADLHDINLRVLDYNIWNSLERPVDSLVFDVLEKKYGKQTSWPKSDRKLLFDSINMGLSEILHSHVDIYTMGKSLKRRCQFTLQRNEVEEELWNSLVNQKNEVRKDVSRKALGKGTEWLKLEEDIGGVCGEIESFLFEELAAELALC